MTLRCKQGDLALVVLGTGTNLGKLVTCLEALPAGACNVEQSAGPLWRVDRPLEFENELGKAEGYLAPDDALMPIGNCVPEISKELTVTGP
jgi:hypothetical protein